jgi:hypothetical protein
MTNGKKALPDSDKSVAFIAAAIVLLVMPVVFLIGLAALALAARLTLGSRAADLIRGDAGPLVLGVIVVWGLIVMAAVLVFVSRLIRRSTRA